MQRNVWINPYIHIFIYVAMHHYRPMQHDAVQWHFCCHLSLVCRLNRHYCKYCKSLSFEICRQTCIEVFVTNFVALFVCCLRPTITANRQWNLQTKEYSYLSKRVVDKIIAFWFVASTANYWKQSFEIYKEQRNLHLASLEFCSSSDTRGKYFKTDSLYREGGTGSHWDRLRPSNVFPDNSHWEIVRYWEVLEHRYYPNVRERCVLLCFQLMACEGTPRRTWEHAEWTLGTFGSVLRAGNRQWKKPQTDLRRNKRSPV